VDVEIVSAGIGVGTDVGLVGLVVAVEVVAVVGLEK